MSAVPAPAPAARWTEARITRIERRTPRLSSVFLQAALAPHVAGQHVDVRLTAPDGYQAQRSYSIASAPGAAEIELAIERLDDGEVSPYFHEVAQPGDTIEVRGPIGGHFIWRPEDGGPVLLVAGGSGIAPLMAIARAWSSAAATTPMLLFYSARTWDDLVYRDELLAMATRTAAFTFVAATTRGPQAAAAGLRPPARRGRCCVKYSVAGSHAGARVRVRLQRVRRHRRGPPGGCRRARAHHPHRALRRDELNPRRSPAAASLATRRASGRAGVQATPQRPHRAVRGGEHGEIRSGSHRRYRARHAELRERDRVDAAHVAGRRGNQPVVPVEVLRIERFHRSRARGPASR